MTVSKKIIVPKMEDSEDIIDDLSNFNLNRIPRKKSKRSIIRISTYSYGSNGIQWHYFSKQNKKK